MPDLNGVVLIVSIDTEEDNWHRSRHDVTLRNIEELLPLARLFARLRIRPTYFTAYQVAKDPRASDILRELCDGGRGEIGAHLHPWNTPPLLPAPSPRDSMLKNLPGDLQLAKLRTLTTALEEAFGVGPRAFRAGRYGLGPETVEALLRCGYRVDSSVCPFTSWEATDDGPTFVGAPMNAYYLALGSDVRRPAAGNGGRGGGGVLEIPLSFGFSRGPFAFWHPVRRVLEAPPFRPLRLSGLAARAGLIQRIALSPELASASDMLTLSRRLLAHGVRHLQLSWHSPTLLPGLSPFARTAADVARLYGSVETYVEGLTRITPVTFATISEAAAVLQ